MTTRGNLISSTNSGQTVQYGYDAQDRLISASLPDGTDISNIYDASGHRVQQSVDSQITNYLWDEASMYGDVVLETGAGNTTSYVLAGSELLSHTRNGTTSYYMQDGQGSTRGLANSAGNVTDTYDYTAFGELQNQTGSTINHYLYTGQQFDDSTGLYSLRARYYNPYLNQFIQPDTIVPDPRTPADWNRYAYVRNNPINYTDPSGYIPCSPSYYEPGCTYTPIRPPIVSRQAWGAHEPGSYGLQNNPNISEGLYDEKNNIRGYMTYTGDLHSATR